MKFRLVDQILEWQSGRSIRGIKAVSFEEYCLPTRLGDREHLPETLALEALLQLGNWLTILSSDYQRMGMVRTINEVEFYSRLMPGQRMAMEVWVNGPGLRGGAHVDDRCILFAVKWTIEEVPLADYADPADLRVLFSEIHR